MDATQMSTFDLENPDPSPGDALRDEAANLLTPRYGRPIRELRVAGKKADLYFTRSDYGKQIRFYVEAKDYAQPLNRSQVVLIWSDYSGIIGRNSPATLLLVTRAGLTPDAQSYVLVEQPEMRHQTIWELENEALGLTEFIRWERELFGEDGLSTYYIEARAREARYGASDTRILADQPIELFSRLQDWLISPGNRPIAILGGYGAGKSSLAKRIVSAQAALALEDPKVRRPVLIRLGSLARYSDLEGLLGGMFTHDFPVGQGFHVRSFLELNKKGRLLIVLDGFDEMKHAMSWPDFRSQIADLNRLTEGDAKVLLLGRPSAFTSADEHFHVLRGIKRWQNSWRRLPDWPEFTEFDLEEFSAEERSAFFRGYLRHRAGRMGVQAITEVWIDERVVEVEMIANLEPDLFAKPVHAKILIDLAADPSVDLSSFTKGMTRWSLYQMFFASLAERETDKAARRPIGEAERTEFLQEVAYWLWTKRGGATSFAAADLPDDIFLGLPQGEATDLEALKREYLSGSILEKKSGDIYYFGHRSFAEFLVAERLVSKVPGPHDQPIYSGLVRDGVLEFLRDAPDRNVFRAWPETVSNAAGTIHLEYFSFLAEMLGGTAALRSALPTTSIWLPILELFSDGPIELGGDLEKHILAAMRTEHNLLFFLLLSLLQLQVSVKQIKPGDAIPAIGAIIIDRLFSRAIYDDVSRKASVEYDGDEARNLAQAAIAEVKSIGYDRVVRFRGKRLLQEKEERLRLAGTDIAVHEQFIPLNLNDDFTFPFGTLVGMLPNDLKDVVRSYFGASSNLSGIFTRQVRQPARRPRRG